MADFVKHPVSPLPELDPEFPFSEKELVFSDEDKKRLDVFKRQYPTGQGAVMKALWLAQEKFGFLHPRVIQLVADELDIPYAQAYGVATFYTQYYKEKMGKYVLDVCTCFTCQWCGGYDVLHHLEQKLGIHKGETTPDGLFTIQEVECLGACGSAPVVQVTNGPYLHNATPERMDELIDQLRQGQMPGFVSVTLPQDEQELGGNRRDDADAIDTYVTPPVSITIR